jgi:hypothetical protein
MNWNRIFSSWMFLLAMLPASRSAWADSVFPVFLNTSPLAGTTQTLAFSLTQGNGVSDSNTITLSDFNFGGGMPLGTPSYTGNGVSGDLNSTVTLADSDFLEFFSQTFQVGSSLSFLLDTTNNNFEDGLPDGFALYLCDVALDTCYSDDLNTGALLVLNLSGSPLTPSDFTVNGASQQGLNAPAVGTPEPRSLALLLAAGLTLAVGTGLRKARA